MWKCSIILSKLSWMLLNLSLCKAVQDMVMKSLFRGGLNSKSGYEYSVSYTEALIRLGSWKHWSTGIFGDLCTAYSRQSPPLPFLWFVLLVSIAVKSHEKATSQSNVVWASSICYNQVLIWTGIDSNIESLLKGNVNSMPKLTTIDMLSNSPIPVSYCSIIYILQWNINT